MTKAEVSHHEDWRCTESPDELSRFRARSIDPLECLHPEDDRAPISGDAWLCGLCGTFVEAPGTLPGGLGVEFDASCECEACLTYGEPQNTCTAMERVIPWPETYYAL